MPLTHHGLKATLHDLKMICRYQLLLAQTIHGFNHPLIETAIREVKATFREFDRSEVWLRSFDFEWLRLLEIMIELEQVQVFDLPRFVTVIRTMIDFLQHEILAPPVAETATEAATSDSTTAAITEAPPPPATTVPTATNQLVLNQLLLNQRQIRNKMRVFKRRGEDLLNNLEFQTARLEYRAARTTYRECLQMNRVNAIATDVVIFTEIGRAIQLVDHVPIFTQVIEKYAAVITSKLPVVDEPEPVDPAIDEPFADLEPTEPPPTDV